MTSLGELEMTDWPEFRAAVDDLLAVVYGGPELPFQLKLEAFTMASVASGCRHCQSHSAHMLSSFGVDTERIQAIWSYSESPLFDDAERVALDFAFAAGQSPNAVTEAHFEALSEHYSRDQILELIGSVTAAAMFNRFNETVATVTDAESVEWATEHLSRVGWEIGRHGGSHGTNLITRRSGSERRIAEGAEQPGGCLVREGGLEPPRPFGHRNLNPARLPIPPLPQKWKGSR